MYLMPVDRHLTDSFTFTNLTITETANPKALTFCQPFVVISVSSTDQKSSFQNDPKAAGGDGGLIDHVAEPFVAGICKGDNRGKLKSAKPVSCISSGFWWVDITCAAVMCF